MEKILTTSRGDTLTFEIQGSGPPLIFVGGAGSFREIEPSMIKTAELVANLGLTTVVYDRIGCGESTGPAPITMDREISALQALLDQVGGSAVLCGHSSGSAISLYAATQGLSITGLALWEVPIIGTAEKAHTWATQFIALLDANNHTGAIEYFVRDMPPDHSAMLRNSPVWNSLIENAQSLRADVEALAWFHSAPLPSLLGELSIPLLTMVGETTFDVMNRGADAITQALPHAQKRVVPGAQHEWDVAPMVEELTNFVTEIETHRNQGGSPGR